MKTLALRLSVAATGMLLTVGTPALGQELPAATKTTTTVASNGTITEFTPEVIAVKITPSSVPVRYAFTKTTTYVDENGNPVSVQTVKNGVPVAVYYGKNGESFVADKVVLKKPVAATTADAAVIADLAPASPPSVDGFVAASDSDEISIRTARSDDRLNYKTRDATAFVDDKGMPVAKSAVTDGVPVTIYYERDGDNLLATRVVVRNSIPLEQTTTMEQAMVPR